MKKNSWLAIAMLVILVETVAPQNTPSAGTGTIRGMVTREGTSDPIPDVQIKLWGKGYGSPVMSVQQAQMLKSAADRGSTFPQDVLQQIQDVLNSAASGSARPAPPPALTATTDSDGHFVIENVPAGSAEVQAQLQGYFSLPVNGVSTGIAYKPFTVAAKQTTEVHLTLVPGGTVSGRLTGPDGKPFPDATIRVLKESYSDGQAVLTISSMKTTDDRGEYRLYRLPPGQYLISAQTASSSPRPPDSLTPAREVPVATLYPGVTDLLRAVPIDIKGGEELTGVNLQMMTAVSAKIRGKVVSTLPAGPVSGGRGGSRPQIATVSMTAHSLHVFGVAARTVVSANPDGSFEIPNVPAGIYDLIARMPAPQGWGAKNPPERATGAWAFGRATVEVRGEDVGVTLVIHSGVDVNGRVMVDGRPASPLLSLTLQPDDSTGLVYDEPTVNTFEQVSHYRVRIEPDGTFVFPLVPEARYRIHAELGAAPPAGNSEPAHTALPKNSYLADVRQGGVSVYDNGLAVDGQSASPLEVIVNTDGGSIEGNVSGLDHSSPANATVVLAPAEGRRQNPALYLVARSDSRGHFVLTRLPPGSYKLFAWANVLPGAYQNAEFLRQYENRGVPVTVLANTKVTAEVGIIP